jgi:hypothetical protein
MNTQINVDETLVSKAATLAQNVSQEDIVAIALREFIDRHEPKTGEKPQRFPKITHGDKTIDPTDLFGLWKEQPKQLSDIRKQAWQRFGLEK